MKWCIKDGVLSKKKRKSATVLEIDENATAVVIPEGVTEIGEKAFSCCKSLTSINIPDGVTEIGGMVFYDCSSLTSITIPEGVTKIGESTFESCSELISITLPEGVTEIGERAFAGCEFLTYITIPKSVTKIGAEAFFDCMNLTSITIPEGVTEIGEDAFGCCSRLTSITIPDSVTVIGKRAFNNELQIHTNHFNVLPANHRGKAKFVYVMDGKDLTTESGMEAVQYARAKAAQNAQWILNEPTLMQAMLREKLIAAKDIDAFHAAAREKGDAELTAQLLDYQTNVLTTTRAVKPRMK